MSNVRRREESNVPTRATVAPAIHRVQHTTMNARANLELVSGTWKATALRLALQISKSSARAEARARTNVGQSVRPQPYRARMTAATRKASVALPRGLRLELGMRASVPTATPNPSVEGMAKRLRLLSTPHLERWASQEYIVPSAILFSRQISAATVACPSVGHRF
jgi:hypothetical protein